ncbi:MAG: hypothetical protein RR220_07065 [Bacteroidaceae bacterium]
MKQSKIVLSALLLLCVCSAFTRKDKVEFDVVYAYGVSASFTDSTVYYTDIQLLDSVRLDKNNFLPQREVYAYQLKNYLESKKGLKNRTCMMYFSKSKMKLVKDFNKTVVHYKRNKTLLQQVNAKDFRFTKPEE